MFENVLVALGYNENESIKRQFERIISNTDLSQAELDHVISLNEKLSNIESFVALSNSEDVLKIKCQSNDKAKIKEFNEIVKDWGEKYNLKLKKVDGKETYYILGRKD